MKNQWQTVAGLLLVGGLALFLVAVFGNMAQPGAPANEVASAPSTSVPLTQEPLVTSTPPSLTPTVMPSGTSTATRPAATQTPMATSTPPASTPTVTASSTPSATQPTTTVTPTVSPEVTPTLDVTDWLTYEDTEYGFRVRYPPDFTYDTPAPTNEILKQMTFDPPITEATEFNSVGLLVLDKREQFASADEWARAHLFSTPNSLQYSLQFESYEIIREFDIVEGHATELLVTSGIGTQEYYIVILLETEVIVFFHHDDDRLALEPIFKAMASTFQTVR